MGIFKNIFGGILNEAGKQVFGVDIKKELDKEVDRAYFDYVNSHEGLSESDKKEVRDRLYGMAITGLPQDLKNAAEDKNESLVKEKLQNMSDEQIIFMSNKSDLQQYVMDLVCEEKNRRDL